jgi:cholesterol oxidase
MSFWPNKGDPDQRPSLGSTYERMPAIMPHQPIVPETAPGALRLSARKEDIIPLYPY